MKTNIIQVLEIRGSAKEISDVWHLLGDEYRQQIEILPLVECSELGDDYAIRIWYPFGADEYEALEHMQGLIEGGYRCGD